MSTRTLLFAFAVAAGLIALSPSALAGGTQVNVAAVAGQVWVTAGAEVVELNPSTGHVVRRSKTRYPYPLDIGVSDGNVWVSSVENGFIAGAITRIPDWGGRPTQALVLPSRPVLALAVGSGTTWALVGPWASLRLAAIDQASGKTTLEPVSDIGWIAADNTGETPGLFGVTMKGNAVRIARNGSASWTADTDRIESTPVVGLRGVWAASSSTLYRLDATRGHIEAEIPIKSSSAQLAVGGGYVWMVSSRETTAGERYTLFKIDPRNARIVKQAKLNGPVGTISYGSGTLWAGQAQPNLSVLRINPTTLVADVFAKNL